MVFKIFDFWLELSPLPYFYEKNVSYCHGKSVFKKKSPERENMYLNTFCYREKQKYRGHIFISHACKTITL